MKFDVVTLAVTLWRLALRRNARSLRRGQHVSVWTGAVVFCGVVTRVTDCAWVVWTSRLPYTRSDPGVYDCPPLPCLYPDVAPIADSVDVSEAGVERLELAGRRRAR